MASLKPDRKLDETIQNIQQKSEKLTEGQKMIIAIIGTLVLVVIVAMAFSFLNSLVS
ncbi:MAG: hypothetical protein OHK0017_11440 [Patescibacteria group bacterium]